MHHRCNVQNLSKLQEDEPPQQALSYYLISMSAHKKGFKVGITVDLGATGGPSLAGATFPFYRRTLCAFFLNHSHRWQVPRELIHHLSGDYLRFSFYRFSGDSPISLPVLPVVLERIEILLVLSQRDFVVETAVSSQQFT